MADVTETELSIELTYVDAECDYELNLVDGYSDCTPNTSIHGFDRALIHHDSNLDSNSIRTTDTTKAANTTSHALPSCSHIIDSSLTVLTFWVTTVIIMLSYFVMSNSQAWSGEIDARMWWQVPPLQALFFVATLCSASELTLRFSRTNHDVDLRSKEMLAGVFLLCAILFVAAPKFTFERIEPAQNVTFSQGNCTDFSNDLSTGDQEAMRKACPTFDFMDAYVQLPKNLTSVLATTGKHSTTRSALVGTVVASLGRVNDVLPLLFNTIEQGTMMGKAAIRSDQYSEYEQHLMKDPCLYLVMSLFCEFSFLRCTHSDCQASEIGKTCVFNDAINNWLQCAADACGSSCAVVTPENRRKATSHILQQVVEHIAWWESEKYLGRVGMSQVEIEMVMFLVEKARRAAAQYGSSINNTKNKMNDNSDCSVLWRNATGVNINIEPAVGCNPKERFFVAAADANTTYDSSNVIAFVFVALSIFVGVAAKHRPVFAFAGVRDERARFISLALGIVAAMFIFLGGQNYENASLDPKFSSATVINLQIWCVVYFAVSWLCMHHAIFLLVVKVKASQSNSKSSTNSQDNTVERKGSMGKLVDMKQEVCSWRQEILSSSGKWNVSYLLVREALESIVQLVGILNTARIADVTDVYKRALLLSLNLIVLPLVVLVADATWGPLVARSILIAVETMFDKAFIVLGVILQSNSGVDASASVFSQLFENLPTLLPAIMFCVSRRTSIMALASMQDTKETNRDSTTRTATTTRSFSLGELAQTLQHTVSGDKERFIITLVGIVSFVLGVALLTHVKISIKNQAQKCEAAVGALAHCLLPKIYFRDNGLFGETACCFENATIANCSGGRLLDNNAIPVQILPEAPNIYTNMTRLILIDVSDNIDLSRLPESWSRVPSLTQINAAGCTSLITLPLKLCSMSTTLRGLDIQSTPCSKALNWSMQFQSDGLIAEACVGALSITLESLDLSHNSIGHSNIESNEFDWIQQLQKLQYLDLSHNSINVLDESVLTLTRNVDANSMERIKSGVNFGGNPVSKFSVQGEAVERVVRILRSLSDENNCARDLTTVEIRASSGNFSAVFEALSQSCFSTSLLRLSAQGDTSFVLLQRGMFQGMSRLEYLDLSNNNLQTIEVGVFAGLRSLGLIHLWNNKLTTIAKGMFEGLRRLNYMTLDHNRLTSIEVESFVDLKSLSFLNLADNDLNSIDVGTFAGLQSLQKLWLMRNKLTSIANGTFLKLLALTGELYIYENKDLVHTSDNITVLRSAWGVPSGCEPGICLRYGERCVAQGCPDDGIIG